MKAKIMNDDKIIVVNHVQQLNNEEIAKAKSVKVGDKLGAQIMEISSTEKRLKDLADLE